MPAPAFPFFFLSSPPLTLRRQTQGVLVASIFGKHRNGDVTSAACRHIALISLHRRPLEKKSGSMGKRETAPHHALLHLLFITRARTHAHIYADARRSRPCSGKTTATKSALFARYVLVTLRYLFPPRSPSSSRARSLSHHTHMHVRTHMYAHGHLVPTGIIVSVS